MTKEFGNAVSHQSLNEQRISDVQNVRLVEGQDAMLLEIFLAFFATVEDISP